MKNFHVYFICNKYSHGDCQQLGTQWIFTSKYRSWTFLDHLGTSFVQKRSKAKSFENIPWISEFFPSHIERKSLESGHQKCTYLDTDLRPRHIYHKPIRYDVASRIKLGKFVSPNNIVTLFTCQSRFKRNRTRS